MKIALIVFACLSVGAVLGVLFMCMMQINKGADAATMQALEAKYKERDNNEQIE